MKTLILCVDRDDDLGAKANVTSPVIGRRRNLEAAMALGLADPEDSDTNAILAAVHVHDRELREADATDQVEVATITGHPGLGLRGDRKLTAELEQVLDLVRPDQVVLVSDGAEDERILPILQSHARVVHVHRSVVKQAPRLEGFYYTLTRILDDPKQARRFVLPAAVLLLFWGISTIVGVAWYAWGATLAFAGAWLLVHAMKWEQSVGRVFRDLGEGMRGGRLTTLANTVLAVLLVVGYFRASDQAHRLVPGSKALTDESGLVLVPEVLPDERLLTLHFVEDFILWAVIAYVVMIAGRLVAPLMRGGSGIGYWLASFALLAVGLLGNMAAKVAVAHFSNESVVDLLTALPNVIQLMAGLGLAMGAAMVSSYVRSFNRAPA